MQTHEEQAALKQACALIPLSRAEEILRLLNWKHGGCLTLRERPKVAELTAAEEKAIRALWNTIPDGSSSWMTAFYRVLHNQRENS